MKGTAVMDEPTLEARGTPLDFDVLVESEVSPLWSARRVGAPAGLDGPRRRALPGRGPAAAAASSSTHGPDGAARRRRPYPLLLVSQRLRRLLGELKAKGFALEVAHLV